jgi:hypothetical protein
LHCQLAAITLYYEQFGEGRPFVVIPGMPSDHRIASSWLEPFFATRSGWQILERYPRATFAVLDHAGHGLGIEQPYLLRALIGEWLDRIEADSQ